MDTGTLRILILLNTVFGAARGRFEEVPMLAFGTIHVPVGIQPDMVAIPQMHGGNRPETWDNNWSHFIAVSDQSSACSLDFASKIT